MSNIFYFMGKSASGKDTLFSKVREKMPQLRTLVGYTTRPAREHEKNGREYFFVTEEKMNQLESEGKMIEKRAYHTVHGIWYYFTADDGQVRENGPDYLLIGTLESYQKIRDYYGEDKVVPVYIEVEDGIRLKRAIEREEQQEKPGYAEVCRRFLADAEDFKEENIEKCGIKKRFHNLEFSICLDEICQYIKERQMDR